MSEELVQPVFVPTPEELQSIADAEAFIKMFEGLRADSAKLQKVAKRLYVLSREGQEIWRQYNGKISDLVAKANAGELSDSEVALLQQFQSLTPIDFVQSIDQAIATYSAAADITYAIDEARQGKWLGIYQPEVIEEEGE